jgi:hypothetical protein
LVPAMEAAMRLAGRDAPVDGVSDWDMAKKRDARPGCEYRYTRKVPSINGEIYHELYLAVPRMNRRSQRPSAPPRHGARPVDAAMRRLPASSANPGIARRVGLATG